MNLNQLINVNQISTNQINNITFVRSSADSRQVISAGIYIIRGQIVLTQPYYIGGDVALFGFGHQRSELKFFDQAMASSTAYGLNIQDVNVEFHTFKFTNTSKNINLLNASNPSKNKNINCTDCRFTECNNSELIDISGFKIDNNDSQLQFYRQQ